MRLRAPEPADAATLNRWANDERSWSMLVGWHFPYSLRSTERWIAERNDADPAKQVYVLEADAGPIGTATLTAIDWKNRTAAVGICVAEPAQQRKGFGTDAVFALMRYAFDELGLARLDAEILDFNGPSLALFAKCGWSQEGCRREWVQRAGRRHDLVLVGILAAEYAEVARRTGYWNEGWADSAGAAGPAVRPKSPVPVRATRPLLR